jgi:imidazolonepropionase-like amidohydrolase
MLTKRCRTSASLALGLLAIAVQSLYAQPTGDTPLVSPPNGPHRAEPSRHAITDATVHVAPGQTLEHATVVIEDGKIVRVATRASAKPIDLTTYQVWNGEGLHIYAGFIDAFVEVDAPAPDPDAPSSHWSAKVTPQRSALDGDGIDESTAAARRKLGFTAANITPRSGIFRGTSAVVSLAKRNTDTSVVRPPVYLEDVTNVTSLDRRGGGYPSSQMGAIAVLRQTLSDAQWQRDSRKAGVAIEPNGIDALGDPHRPLLFDVRNELEILRAAAVADEFERPAIIVGGGTAYRRLDAIKAAGYPLIVPLRFTASPDVSSVGAAESVSLKSLMAWEQDPTNLRRLDAAGVQAVITASKLNKGDKFHANLRKAIEHGLSEDRALAMLTTAPADLLGMDDRMGTVEVGKVANLIVTDGPIFEKKTKIRDVWADGFRHEINASPGPDLDGTWTLSVGDFFEMTLIIKGKAIDLVEGEEKGKARKVTIKDGSLSFLVDDNDGETGAYIMSGTLTGDHLTGTGIAPDSSVFQWTATRNADESDADEPDADKLGPDLPDAKADKDDKIDDEETDKHADIPERLGHPFGPYMMDAPPAQNAILITNATIWTSGPAGIIANGQIYFENGVIKDVRAMNAPGTIDMADNTIVIDARGKHVTPGMIDAHSHTGTWSAGTNEGSQAITSEVRMQDTTDPDPVNWYRQLAGGTTLVNTLHGSANPIGGQNVVQKVRWGAVAPNDMHMAGAIAGIKFALGENVKRARSRDSTRYPRTRMGVDALMRDRFTAAQHYAQQWADWRTRLGKALDGEVPQPVPEGGVGQIIRQGHIEPLDLSIGTNVPRPRRDLELEAIAEILAGERLVHCHSYRQDEILMLCRIAQDYGFKIGTFQHILEGYKVAEAIKANAIGASSFSDWWAYKIEVQDAIPYNGAIMHDVGVVVSFNSDDDELSRRMNTEAAKAVRYGNIDPAEALKFVTINPAIQLMIDDRVGSLEAGKDADIVIWSGDPLSTLTRCETVFIDGRKYFSLEEDQAHRDRIAAERSRIIQKLIADDKKGKKKEDKDKEDPDEPGNKAHGDPNLNSDAIAYADALREYCLDLYLRGLDPLGHVSGDCGISLIEHVEAYMQGQQLNHSHN